MFSSSAAQHGVLSLEATQCDPNEDIVDTLLALPLVGAPHVPCVPVTSRHFGLPRCSSDQRSNSCSDPHLPLRFALESTLGAASIRPK